MATKKTSVKKTTKKSPKAKPVARRKTATRRKKTSAKKIILMAHWEGRFGNRMYQYAYGAQYAKKFNFDFILPSDWEGTRLFKKQFHKVLEDDQLRLEINQSASEFNNIQFRTQAMERYSFRTLNGMVYLNPDIKEQSWAGLGNVWYSNICAYNSHIFSEMSSDFMRNELFVFSDEIKKLDVYKMLEDKQGTYDIAHLRRDDISNPNYNDNYGYSVVSKKSYEKAFEKFGYDPKKIEWTSDDWDNKWGVGNSMDDKWFTRRGGWRYPEGAEYIEGVCFDWLPDFLRLYFARTVFRANSSFSWWACFLGNQKKTFSPVLHTRNIYSGKKGSGLETDFDFVEGNNPHWLVVQGEPCDHIIIPD